MVQITRGFNPMGDRYDFDFKMCTIAKGWAQLDTRQDASYYGHWVNPTSFEVVGYVEGDVTRTKYDTEAEFKAGFQETLTWHSEREYNPKIDPGNSAELRAAFERLGFKEYLL